MPNAAADHLPATAPPPAPARFPLAFWVLAAGFGVSRTGAVLVPYLTLYLVTSLHLSAAQAGTVLAVFGVGWVLGQPLAGAAADRLGRKTTIAGALAATAAAYALLARATTVPELMTLAAVIGLVFDAPRTAVGAWIADLVPAERRARGYGIQYWALNVGGALSGVVGGYLASSHITWLCAVDAATCTVFALAILALPGGKRPAGRGGTNPSGQHQALRDGRLLAFSALSLGVLTVYQQMVYGVPLAIHADGLSAGVYGAVNVANALAVLALQPLLQPWMDRTAPLRVCAAGAAAIGLGMGANAFAHSTAGYVGAAVVWTVGEITFCVGAAAHVSSLAPDSARGRYLGIWGSAFGGSALLAPLLGAAALDLGTGWLWAGSALLAALCAAALTRQDNRPLAHRP
ncbi:MFS transporter [Kitasatospora sp. NA04385]|uniref:MFS transporter n=1 Tax=Kitasatospora sp. NA04385 TaxID=2742135 RepID=UPI00159013A1|nr:MFS transporter [Kitasatospora sp. NA04385]QKW20596.1 MFS transporter [Kitasatospora sp. NA04385]